MLPLNNTSSSQTSAQTTTAPAQGTLGKDDFLKLMISQLKYQDPMSPMDGTQFASQLAQFSSLEQLSNLNTNVENSINANYVLTQSINNTMSATLIGKDVKLSGPNIQYASQSNIQLGYNLPANAETAQLNIYDSQGNIVKTINNVATTSGDHKLSWDFTDNSGNKVPVGAYTFDIKAKDVGQNNMTSTYFKYGTIDGIKFSDSGSQLMIDGAAYSLSDIAEILNPGSGSKGGIF
jgi:flagellar basal-body rod modification protein FlgD